MSETPKSEEVPVVVQEDERKKWARINKSVLNWKPPANELDAIDDFDTAKAWDAILTLPTCQEIMIYEENQKILNLVVGVNVTQEFPWKQVPFRKLRDNLFDDLTNGQILYDAFQGFNINSPVLIGYVPLITQDMENPPQGDPFVLFVNPADAKLALAIIRNLETFERLMINKRLHKFPRAWVSLGSGDEVNLAIAQRYHEPVDVEIQSVYPLHIPSKKEFETRLTSDVRDGYVELIPSESARFENVIRRRITVGIQSSLKRIDMEQQTDPTFPTNAWAQYFYEINEEEDCLDLTEDEGERRSSKVPSRTATPEPKPIKPPPELSSNIKFLLKTLEFNQVNMYRNDYPKISNMCILHHTTPTLEETLCFANISKSQNRYVCGYDWYPALAGLIVTSYTFSTAATLELVSTKVDFVQQAVLQPKPILMWSFDDNLNYKLEFEAPLQVTTLSFCPYNANILLGGTSNGQIILWDLQNRAERLDDVQHLSAGQMKYRLMMNEHLKWTIQIDEDVLVSPATVTLLEKSQKAAITSIKWLGSKCSVNSFGKVSIDLGMPKKKRRFFMSSSMDGTISFWDLDSKSTKKAISSMRRDLPQVLTQSESVFKGKVMEPVYSIDFHEPLTGMVADTPVFKCLTKESAKPSKNIYNYRIETVPEEPTQVRQSCIVSTFYGKIERIAWLGLYSKEAACEHITTSQSFARAHNGPIIMMKRNSFFPWLFVSIGRNIFAVWKEDYNYSPIFWRKCKNDLTAVDWCHTRPSVLFLTRIDGSLEVWDILARDDDACYNEVLGGGIVTQICEHKPQKPDKLLGIGDYNSSLRMVKLPKSFYVQFKHETDEMLNYILKEESRKKDIQKWEQKYYERNMEVIEAKRQAELEAHKEIERQEKERIFQAHRDAIREEAKKDEPAVKISYTERMKRQWYAVNMNRMLNILMSRKRVNQKQLNQETVLEKERLAYEAAKKKSLQSVLNSIADELAAVRLRIYPLEVPDVQRSDMIESSVNAVMNQVDSYDDIELEINEILSEAGELGNVEYAEFLTRGDKRRKHVNKSLGGNTERAYWYDVIREEGQLGDCNWGFEMFADLLNSFDVGSRPPSIINQYDKGEESLYELIAQGGYDDEADIDFEEIE